MTRIELLKTNFQRVCSLPWERNIAGAQRVWLAVYDKEDERRLHLRLALFEEVAQQTGHPWHSLDLTDSFAEWVTGPTYARFANSFFEKPERLGAAQRNDFAKFLCNKVSGVLNSDNHSQDSLLALIGVGSLFGCASVSQLIALVEPNIRGRLLVFFPGVYEQDNYRLLDARDGWNYHAIPITASESEARR